MKYKLINTETNEEHLCDKVTIDGFDYYVSYEADAINPNDIIYELDCGTINRADDNYVQNINDRKILATNDPTIGIPKVVDEVEELAFAYTKTSQAHRRGFIDGYNKSQETHPFTEEDMIEFAEWKDENKFSIVTIYKEWYSELLDYSGCFYTTQELLQLWKEQQPKTVYYR